MSDATERPDDGGAGAEALSAIAAFEDILEVFPDDCTTLDALVHSCKLVGDRPKTGRYLAQLVGALLQQGDGERAAALLPTMHDYVDIEATLVPLIERVQELTRDAVPAPEKAAPAPSGPARAPANIASPDRAATLQEELAMAWRLHEGGLLDSDAYANIVQDLTDISGRAVDTISVLHVLQDRGTRNLEAIVAFAARQTGVPVVPANSFEPTEDAVRTLPIDFALAQGALCFDLIAEEALIAVLNPYSHRTREAVRAAAGRPCHFYLTLPTEFDAWITRAREVLKRMADG